MVDVSTLLRSKTLTIWWACAATGACLFWSLFVLMRAMHDDIAPWRLLELWLPLLLSVLPVSVLVTSIRHSSVVALGVGAKIKEIFLWSTGLMAGGSLVLIWHLQVLQHNVVSQKEYAIAHATSNAQTLERVMSTQSCDSQKSTLMALAQEHGKLTFMDKMWIKEKSLSLHQSQCLSAGDVFEVVRLLKSQNTLHMDRLSASFNWSFVQPHHESDLAARALPITRSQWCEATGRQQLSAQGVSPSSDAVGQLLMMCANQPNSTKPLSSPEHYAWIKALSASSVGVSP